MTRAGKLGYYSVAERFICDATFRQQMQKRGWTAATIGQIDAGADEPPKTGYRTSAQIQESKRDVCRGKEFAAADEKWDKAYKWSVTEESEWRHQKKARKWRSAGSSRSSYYFSYWQ